MDKEKREQAPAELKPLEVLYEDDRFVIVNKPIGASVQDDSYGESPLGKQLEERYREKLFLIHRIDKPVSGAIVFARTPEAQRDLEGMFADRSVDKRYWAVVETPPPTGEGTVESWLYFDTKQNKTFVFAKKPEKTPQLARGAKLSSLSYRTIGSSDRYCYLEVQLHTGRHHQVRAQLAQIGCHIKGDLKYGSRRSDPGGGIHLHARSIAFVDPATGIAVSGVASPPDDALWRLFLTMAGEKNAEAVRGEGSPDSDGNTPAKL